MVFWVVRAIVAFFRPKASLVAENLCLRQQLLVLQRRRSRPRLQNPDRRFWILASRWYPRWRKSLLIVTPGTVLGWHRRGWKTYWRWRSRPRGRLGRKTISSEVKALIRRMATENFLWGQKRIQAELVKLGFKVSARTVAKYMRGIHRGKPSPNWRSFLSSHAQEIWACDFFCVQTILFRTIYVFFIVHHGSREVVHVRTTRHPTSEWTGRQIVEACGWDRAPPRFLIHDRDSRYGAVFHRRIRNLGITSIRTPFRSPRANAIAERWVKSVRTECLDHYLILNERHLHRVLAEYVTYFNLWRPHRSVGQQAPCAQAPPSPGASRKGTDVVARPVLSGLHHVYDVAA
ncbi:MAG: transposase [Alphaproteobacteria bacterium]|nr:transposase [Alphaproteobacteria bacterium]